MFGLETLGVKVEIPPAEVDADLAIPAFNLDAAALAEKITALRNPLFASVAVVGKYVNIKLNLEQLAPQLIAQVLAEKEQYGHNRDGAGQTVMIEYSGPNIAKPMHMGHLRNNAIGHALVNIYRASGYRVITTNHLGDWGMSLAKIMLAYQRWGDPAVFANDPIHHLLDLYIRITKEIEANPALEDEARVLFKKLEDGDAALRALWQKMRDVSVADFKRVYALLGIDFDLWHGESFYEPLINETIEEALDKKVATHEAGGPVIVNLDEQKLPSYLLRKTDGASLYGARDLAVGRWRLNEYHPDLLIYVVGHEQELYLKQIFATLGLMGYPEEKFQHISYGIVTLAGKKIATRSGNIIFLEDALQQAIARAKGIPEVGIGAIVFNMLSQGREHDIAFSWETALNLQGNSGPYLQYAFVRCKSILEKSETRIHADGAVTLTTDHERRLIKLAAHFPTVVSEARKLNSPHLIATFLNNFVQEFNRFYATSPILTSEDEAVKNTRLLLTAMAAQIIKNGLGLLGIDVPEKM